MRPHPRRGNAADRPNEPESSQPSTSGRQSTAKVGTQTTRTRRAAAVSKAPATSDKHAPKVHGRPAASGGSKSAITRASKSAAAAIVIADVDNEDDQDKSDDEVEVQGDGSDEESSMEEEEVIETAPAMHARQSRSAAACKGQVVHSSRNRSANITQAHHRTAAAAPPSAEASDEDEAGDEAAPLQLTAAAAADNGLRHRGRQRASAIVDDCVIAATESAGEEEDEAAEDDEGGGGGPSQQAEQGGKHACKRRAGPAAAGSIGGGGAGRRKRAAHVVDGDEEAGGTSALDLLAGQALDTGVLKALYADLPEKNLNKKQRLLHQWKGQQPSWHLSLRRGFSLLFQGFGSKRSLIESFVKEHAEEGSAVIAFRGLNPRVTGREVVTATANLFQQRSFKNADLTGLIQDIAGDAERHVYVVVHNLEGPGLWPDMALLAELSACPNVHLLASCDHVNSGLLFDAATDARFRWRHVQAPTYAPYVNETADRPFVLTGTLQAGTKVGLVGLLKGVVANSREVFRVLAEAQMDDPTVDGIGFAHLLRMCRERFLVSSDTALRGHLTEFLDHQLIKQRLSSEGADVLYIPLAAGPLATALAEMDAVAE